VPRTLSYIDGAAPLQTLEFMLIGAVIMLPPLLYYTYYSYKIFSGKVTQRLGY
jgi:cytochrome d ubiquinol oxidase subunit II